MTEIRSILFLCVANSARSQMAEGLARANFGDRMQVQSAGSNPGTVHPLSIAVLAERNIDISDHQSKSVDDIDPAGVDTVVTLCSEEVCPTFFGNAQQIHWPLPDPVRAAGEDELIEGFRRIRDEIDRRLHELVSG